MHFCGAVKMENCSATTYYNVDDSPRNKKYVIQVHLYKTKIRKTILCG